MVRASVGSTIVIKPRKAQSAKRAQAGKVMARARARSFSAMPAATGFRPGYGMSGRGGEKKVIDAASFTGNLDTVGTVKALNLCAQGTDYTNRVGRIIQLKSVQLRGFVMRENASTATSQNGCRVMLVWDSQPNGGAIASISDILNNGGTDSTAFMNLTNRDRFKVIRDDFFMLGQVSTTATQAFAFGEGNHVINWYVPLGPEYQTQFGGTGSTIGDVQHGSLLFVCLGSVTDAGTVADTLQYSTRVRFTDN